MKKHLTIFVMALLLILMPVITAMPQKYSNNVVRPIRGLPSIENIPQTIDDPPEWARGNFSGVWGLTILGLPLEPAGWIRGYYEEIGLGRFVGEFAEFGETNATGGLIGYMLWIFFLGGVGSLSTGNGTYVSGIGVANETHYYLRLSAIIGPSYYVHVKYTRFNETKVD